MQVWRSAIRTRAPLRRSGSSGGAARGTARAAGGWTSPCSAGGMRCRRG